MIKNKWSVTAGAVVLLGVFIAAGYILTKQDSATVVIVSKGGETHAIADLNVTYQLKSDTQKLYNIQVMSANQAASQNSTEPTGTGDVFVSGKACNNMSGTIPLLPAGTSTELKIIKTLKDGRMVLEPQVMSTMMACMGTTPATDDQALTKVFNDIATSLQSL
jgi:heat shock protein HslJ